MFFKQKLDNIQLKKWLDSRLYLDSLQIKSFLNKFWTNGWRSDLLRHILQSKKYD